MAGAHHLNLVYQTFNKDQHGLRLKDLDHTDKQNYESVVRLTSQSSIQLLKKIPDGLGTRSNCR
jgi:hypothetical protein